MAFNIRNVCGCRRFTSKVAGKSPIYHRLTPVMKNYRHSGSVVIKSCSFSHNQIRQTGLCVGYTFRSRYVECEPGLMLCFAVRWKKKTCRWQPTTPIMYTLMNSSDAASGETICYHLCCLHCRRIQLQTMTSGLYIKCLYRRVLCLPVHISFSMLTPWFDELLVKSLWWFEHF